MDLCYIFTLNSLDPYESRLDLHRSKLDQHESGLDLCRSRLDLNGSMVDHQESKLDTRAEIFTGLALILQQIQILGFMDLIIHMSITFS